MKLRVKLILCGVLSIVTVGVLGVLSHGAYADSGDYVLTISPAKQKVGELQPGEHYEGTFEVINDGKKDIAYTVYTTGYQVSGENYDASYTDGTYTTISKWITFSQTSGILTPKERDEITFAIDVPMDAPAGGQYAAIMVESDNSIQDNATIGATTRLGMIVYSHVAGETKNCTKIISTNMNTFLVNPPISASSVVENCGNVDVDAEYALRIFPLFSEEEIYTNEETPDTKTILPETKRFNSISWDNAPALGIFRVEEIVKIGDAEETLSKIVVVCPLWLIILIIVFIGACIFWLIARSRGRKQARKANSTSSASSTNSTNKEKE